MRVLMISHAMVTRSNHRLAEELSAYPDVQLTVLTPPWWDEESRHVQQEKRSDPRYRIRIGQMGYFRQPKPNLFFFRSGLAKALRQAQPDIIDAYEEPFSLVMGQLLLLNRMFAPQARLLFYSAQNIYKRYPPPFSLFERAAFRRASYAYVCASEVGTVLRRKGYRKPLKLIPLAADETVFKPMPEARAAVRTELGIALEQRVVGYLGRLSVEKGVQDLVAALPLLPSDTRLLIVGGGEREPLERQAQGLGVAERLIFTGAVNRLDAPRYLNAMDLLVVPSHTTAGWKEQFGRIIVEAFMCGVPVLGSDSGAIPEVVADTGLIFPEGDVSALAAAACRLLEGANLGAELREHARVRALAEFTWPKVAADRYAIYKEMMSDK
jgi:glycosyltransferase involved in cell wall biosynthesis